MRSVVTLHRVYLYIQQRAVVVWGCKYTANVYQSTQTIVYTRVLKHVSETLSVAGHERFPYIHNAMQRFRGRVFLEYGLLTCEDTAQLRRE